MSIVGLLDRLRDMVPGGGSPDAGQQRTELNGDLQSEQGGGDLYDGFEPEEIGRMLRDTDVGKRKSILNDEEFISNEWKDVEEAIRSDPELASAYGVDHAQKEMTGGGEVCAHHGTAIETESYRPTRTTVSKRSRATSESLDSRLDASVASTGGQTGETLSAGAERHETSSFQMKVCTTERRDCPTSLKGFFNAAGREYDRHQRARNGHRELFEQAAEQEMARGAETGRDGPSFEADQSTAQAAQDTGEFVFDNAARPVGAEAEQEVGQQLDEEAEQEIGGRDVDQSQDLGFGR